MNPEFLTQNDKISVKRIDFQTNKFYNHACGRQATTEAQLDAETRGSSSKLVCSVLPSDLELEEENMIHSFFSKIVPAKLRQSSTDHLSLKMVSEGSDKTNQSNSSYCTLPNNCSSELFTLYKENTIHEKNCAKEDCAETWSEISLTLSNKTTPESEKQSDKHGEIWTEVNLNDSSSQSTDTGNPPGAGVENTSTTPIRLKLDSSLSNWISRSSVDQNNSTNGSRRQSLDTLIMGSLATGERVKEILSQGIMKLNISSLTERRSSEPRTDKPSLSIGQANVMSASKKVPSPLEKSILYLNPEEDSASDSESLAR